MWNENPGKYSIQVEQLGNLESDDTTHLDNNPASIKSQNEGYLVREFSEQGVEVLSKDNSNAPNFWDSMFTSPRRLAEKFPWFRRFYKICQTAEETQGELAYLNKMKINEIFGTTARLAKRVSRTIEDLQPALIINHGEDLVKLWDKNPGKYSIQEEQLGNLGSDDKTHLDNDPASIKAQNEGYLVREYNEQGIEVVTKDNSNSPDFWDMETWLNGSAFSSNLTKYLTPATICPQ